ncbi:MAG: TolC family protein, partial [Bacteroidia bacterium]
LFFIGCKGIEKTTPDKELTLPNNFKSFEAVDTSTFADYNWKDIFNDKYLQELISIALENNLDLIQTDKKIQISNNNYNFSKNTLLPSVNTYGNAGQTRFGDYTMDGVGNYDTNFSPNINENQKMNKDLPDFHVGLSVGWEVDVWGKLKSRKKSAYAKFLASEEGKNLLLSNLICKIAYAYYELISYDYSIYYIKESIVLLENALSIIKAQKEAGLTNELAVQQFEAALYNTKAYEKTINQKIIETESDINMLLGRFPQTIKRTPNIFSIKLPNKLSYGIPSQLLNRRPDIRQSTFNLIAANADIDAAKKAFYPSLNINANGGFKSFNPSFFLNPASLAYNVIGNLSAPLINRNEIKRNFKNADANQLIAYYEYQKSILTGYTEVYNQLNNFKNSSEVVELKKKETEILSKAVESANALFMSGGATYIEVLLAQMNSLKSKIALSEAKLIQLNSHVGLYKALGGGWK